MLGPGAVLADKYLVDRVIGQGGMATVVAATHLHLNEPVAIKMLDPKLAADATIVERFMREARAAVRLKGEHVTRVLDVGILPQGTPYIVMELLVGIDLGELLKARSILSPPEAADVVLQVCEALAEAHASGIVHRDIKPSNLFVTTRPDGSPLIKVLDFGISKTGFDNQVSNLTQNAIVGTPSYMSPEQLRGLPTVDSRSDIWSLGIVLYRLLSGVRPFKADSMSALAIQCATEPTPSFHVQLPPGLDAIVYRCLEKDAAHRFQSVAELAYALAPYAGDQRAAHIVIERTQNILRWKPPPPPVVPQPRMPGEPTTLGSSAVVLYTPTPMPMPAPSRSNRGLLIGGVAIAIIAITLGAVALVGRGDDAEKTAQPAAAPSVPAATTPAAEEAKPPVVEDVKPPVVEEAKAPVVEEAKPAVVETKVADKKKPKAKPASGAPATKVDAKPVVETKPSPKPEPEKPKPKSNPLDTRM
jgi:serine/threonine-protein kinase